MRVAATVSFVFLLFLVISCNGPEVGAPVDRTEVAQLVEKVSNSGVDTTVNKAVKEGFCKLCTDKDLLIVFLYLISLLFSCLYYKHTGEHHGTLEENLAILSKKLTWRHRLFLFIAGWLHEKIKNKTAKENKNDDTK